MMHRHQSLRTLPRRLATSLSLVFITTLAAACGPITFQDSSGFGIAGTPPEPEAAPAPPRVEVRDNRIVINEKIQFEYDSAKILPVSHDLLNEVASTIKQNPQIKKLEIQGHASSEGEDDYNLKLSDKRAKSVMEYLTKTAGIDKTKLTSKGYGESQPIASNDTDEGREKNRRVEFVITEQEVTQKKVEITPDGQERVVEEQTISG